MDESISVIITQAISSLGGGMGFFIIFLYLYIKEKETYLKYWTVYWGLTAISLFIYSINLSQMNLLLVILYELSFILSGYTLQKGTSLYVNSRKTRKYLLGILYVSLIASLFLVLYSKIVENIFVQQTVASITYISISYIIVGLLLYYHSKEFFPKTIGVISLLFGLTNQFALYYSHYTWFMNYIYPLHASLGSIFGLGLIGIHYKNTYNKIESIKQQYQNVVETQQELVCRYKPDTTLTFINQAFCKILNTDNYKVIGTKLLNYIPEEKHDYIAKMISSLSPENPTIKYEHPFILPDMSIIYIERIDQGFFDEKGSLKEIQGVGRDITIRQEKEAIIRRLSFHDQLTDLYNRRYFQNTLEELNKSNKIPISIMLADMDDLKHINDNYGHQEGDRFIKKTSEILKKCIRKNDILARIGGDEFSIILPGIDSRTAQKIYHDINNEVKIFNKQSDLPAPIQISIGYATKVKIEENLNDIFKQADFNMYKNKDLNRKGLS